MQLFAKKFYGFNPQFFPVITFRQSGSRDRLLQRSNTGDRIVFIAVEDDNANSEEQGKILGMAEIGRQKIRSLDLVKDTSQLPQNYFDDRGEFKWPSGLPMLRAWRFTPSMHRLQLLNKSRIDSQATRSNVILLEGQESEAILSLPNVEVTIPETEALLKVKRRSSALSDEFPVAWKLEVARMTNTVLATIKNSNGQKVLRTVTDKNSDLSEGELQIFLRQMLIEQNYRCNVTNKRLNHGDGEDWLRPSLDRIDSHGHYTVDNLQIVSKAVNRAKSDVTPERFSSYFDALQIEPDC